MDTTITISTPEIALFDRVYLENMVKAFIKTLAQGTRQEESGLPILTDAELAQSCSVDEAEQKTLEMIHRHFHPAI